MANTISWTDNQKKAVLANGKLLVSASAGTGKTTVMVANIVRRLSEGASLRNALVLVYNNAAAAEIREKLANALFVGIRDADNEQIKEHLKNQMDMLTFAEIKTMHAFCLDMLRTNFEVVGLSPGFEIVSNKERRIFIGRAMRATFSEYYRTDDSTFSELIAVLGGRSEKELSRVIEQLNTQVEIQPDPDGFLDALVANCLTYSDGVAGSFILDDIRKRITILKETALDMLPMVNCDVFMVYFDALYQMAECCKRIEDSADFRQLSVALSQSMDFAQLGNRGTKKIDASLRKAISSALKDFKEYVSSLQGKYGDYDRLQETCRIGAEHTQKLVEITRKFRSRYDAVKSEYNRLDYSDLEHYAVKLLDTAAEDVKARYQYVFVDEYQDFNPIQEYIVSKLLCEEAFFVGDVKQSIYGFRLACPELFLKRYAEYAVSGCALELGDNFRSSASILNFVNTVFSRAMTVASCQIDYSKKGSFVVEPAEISDDVSIVLFDKEKAEQISETGEVIADKKSQVFVANQPYSVLRHPPEAKCDDISVSEAEGIFIANAIKSRLGTISEKTGKRLNYGDFALLFRSLKSNTAATIAATLKREGIPFDDTVFSINVGDYEENEVISLLRTLNNPTQDIALVAFLLSPFCSYGELVPFDEAELYDVRQYYLKRSVVDDKNDYSNYGNSFLDAMKHYDGKYSAKVALALDRLDTLIFRSGYKNVFALLSGIISDVGYEAFVLAREDGSAKLASLNLFLRRIETGGAVTVSSFLEYYDKSRAEKTFGKRKSDDDATVLATEDKVVVATIHKSKGLEYEVVFLVDVTDNLLKNSDSKPVIVENASMVGVGDLFGIKYFDTETKTPLDSLSIDAARTLQKRREQREEMRLQYVAFTRAKSKLYLLGENSNLEAKQNWFSCWSILAPAVNAGLLENVVHFYTTEDMRAYKRDTKLLTPDYATDEEGLTYKSAIERVIGFKYPYADATSMQSKYSVTALNQSDEIVSHNVFDGAEQLSFDAGIDRRDIGTAYHAVMEKIPFTVTTTDEVSAVVRKLSEEGIISDEIANTILPDTILKCINNPIMRAAARADKVYRELPFVLYVPANMLETLETELDDRVLVQGVIDLLIVGEEVVIVDYKASVKDLDSLAKTYKKQLDIYKMAVETSIGRKVDRIALLSLFEGKAKYLD